MITGLPMLFFEGSGWATSMSFTCKGGLTVNFDLILCKYTFRVPNTLSYLGLLRICEQLDSWIYHIAQDHLVSSRSSNL